MTRKLIIPCVPRKLLPLAIQLLCILICLSIISCNKSPEKTSQSLKKTANKYFNNNNYKGALEIWIKVLDIKPSDASVYEKIGDCYYKMAKYHQALQAYHETIRLQPSNWLAIYKTAKIQLSMMNIYMAEKNWEKVKNHINNCDALIFNGDLLLLKKNYADAEQEYRHARLRYPQNQTAMIRLAICLAGQKKTAEANEIFKILISLSPQSPEVLLQMSNFCSIISDYKLAQTFIDKTLIIAPHNSNLQIKLAKLYLETEEYQQAITILQKFHQAMPDNQYAKKMLIESLLLNNNFQEAGNLLEELTETEEKNLEFQLLKGKYYLNTMKLQEAIAQFQTILELEPDIPLAHYFMGLAYLATGMNNLGQRSLTRCLSLNPHFTQAELVLADVYFKNKNYDLALEHAERIKKQEPGNYRSYLITGNIHQAKGEYQEAIADFYDAEYLHPEGILPLYHIALCTFLEGSSSKSINLYQTLLEKTPSKADAALRYGMISYHNGESQKGIQFLQKVINENHENPYLRHILGEMYLATNNHEEAINEFNKALNIKPNLKPTYLKLFELYTNDQQKLEKLLITAIAKIHTFTEAHTQLAKLYCKSGSSTKAISILEKALKSDPTSPYLANNLALIYLEFQPGKIDKAMRFAQIAYGNLPNNPAIADTLGWIYYKKNMFARASWLLKQAKSLDPGNQIINSHLKTILEAAEKAAQETDRM